MRDYLHFLSQTPVTRAVIPFCFGIVFGLFGPDGPDILMAAGGLSLILLVLLALLHTRRFRLTRWRFGFAVLICAFCLGWFSCLSYNEHSYTHHFQNQPGSVRLVKICQPLREKKSILKTIVQIQAQKEVGKWQQRDGFELLYLAKSHIAFQLKPGEKLLLTGKLDSIPRPLNPGQFNYRRFLSFKRVHYQEYCDSLSWVQVPGTKTWETALQGGRQLLLHRLDLYPFHFNAKAVLDALVLGQRQFVGEELSNAYAHAGAMHVLAVSGLHVGLIYLLILTLLKLFPLKWQEGWGAAIFTLIVLWMYAAITGFSPSVLRATAMFSCIILVKSLKRSPFIFNALAISAFLLLLINPNLLVSVGFQLSYCAVIGIVVLQPHIYRWYTPSNWLFDKAWQLTSVSVAAQLATFPLGLLYFHTFPVYFFISNLVVIPSAFIILLSGLFFLMVARIPVISSVTGWSLDHYILGLNSFLRSVEKWPFSLVREISITTPESILIYLFLLLFIAFIYNHQHWKWQYAAMPLIILLFWQVENAWKEDHQRKLVIFDVRGQTAISVGQGRSVDFISDSLKWKQPSQFEFHISKAWSEDGYLKKYYWPLFETREFKQGMVCWRPPVLLLNKERFIIVSKKMDLRFVQSGSWVLLTHNCLIDCKKLDNIKIQGVIVDASNSVWRRKRWKTQAALMRLPFWDTSKNGAFVLSEK